MVGKSGTTLVSPFHRYAQGKDLSELPPESLAELDALVVDLPRGAKLVGIDSLDIGDTKDGSRPAHTLLLGAEIPIAEHLVNLAELPREDFRFSAVPRKYARSGIDPSG